MACKYKVFRGVTNVGIRHDDAMVEHLSISHQMAKDDCLSRSEAESMENLDGGEVVGQTPRAYCRL